MCSSHPYWDQLVVESQNAVAQIRQSGDELMIWNSDLSGKIEMKCTFSQIAGDETTYLSPSPRRSE